MNNLELKHKELMEELTKLRDEYPKKLSSWGTDDVGKWWRTQVDSALSQIAEVAREEERQKIWTAIEPLIIVWGNDTAKRVRNYFTNLKNPVGTEEKE